MGFTVWAKYLSYPWWSAVVYDDDLPEIPKNVLQQAHNKDDYLVRFYDKSDLWYVYQDPKYNVSISPLTFQGVDTSGHAQTPRRN